MQGFAPKLGYQKSVELTVGQGFKQQLAKHE
jgi:hypothetical protein